MPRGQPLQPPWKGMLRASPYNPLGRRRFNATLISLQNNSQRDIIRHKYIMDSEICIDNNSDTLIVCFGGFALKMGGIAPYDFLNFITTNFTNVDKIFYRDVTQLCYHRGFNNITTDIETTVIYLREKIKKYKRVIFTGSSAGAYAALLYGSLLNVHEIIAFKPVTILQGRKDIYNLRFIDLSKDIINKTTKYYLYGDTSITNTADPHHISHCENIRKYPNVNVYYINGINLKRMKDSGKLYNIYDRIIRVQDKPPPKPSAPTLFKFKFRS
jgi:hypothetical protein